MAWSAEVDVRRSFVPSGKVKPNGEPVLRPVTHTYVVLSRGCEAIRFTVTRRQGSVTLGDRREEATGAAPLTNRGPLPGEQYCKAGVRRSLTPSAWAHEVERLIGWQRAVLVLAELGAVS